MTRFLVRYRKPKPFQQGLDTTSTTDWAVLIVEAGSRAEAFTAAYDHLTMKGYAVSTELENQLRFENYPHLLVFSDNELETLREFGVQLGLNGNIVIDSITEYEIDPPGTVLDPNSD